MANLRELDMDIAKAWRGERAARVRRLIRQEACSCPLANQMYANILLDPEEMARVLSLLVQGWGSPRLQER